MVEPLLTRPFVLLLLGHFVQGLGWTSMLLLPVYLESIGANRTEIGAVMSLGGVGGLVALPFAGRALDRLGRRPTLVTGALCAAVGLILLGFVTEVGNLLRFSRVLAGVGTGTLFAGYFAFVSDFIPASRRTEGIALFGISGLLPLLLMPFAGQVAGEASQLRWVFPAASLGLFASIAFVLAVPEKAFAPGHSEQRWWQAVTRPTLRPVWVANIVFATAVAVFMAFAAVTAGSSGMDEPARVFIPYAIGAIVVRLVGGRLPDRVGPSNMVVPAVALYAGGLLGFAMGTSEIGFMAAALACGIGHGYCFPVIASQVVSRSPEEKRGSAMAFSTGIWEASAITMQPLFGAIADATGDAWIFIGAAMLCTIGLLLWLALELRATSTQGAPTAERSPAPPG